MSANYPKTATDPQLAKPLADLGRAMDLNHLWCSVVALLDAALPNFHYITALPCVEDRPVFVNTTLPLRDEPGYWERFISCEPPLARVLQASPGMEIAFLNDHWGDEELKGTRFYEQIMKPEGWWYAAGFLFWDGSAFTGHIGMNRTPDQGPYLPHERDLLRDLHGPIAAAVQRVAAFDAERAKRAAMEAVLQQLPDGMAILDWELRLIFSNRAADEACQLWADTARTADCQNVGTLPTEVKEAAAELLAGSERWLRQPPPGKLSAPAKELEHAGLPGLKARLRLLHPREKQAIKPHCLVEFSRVVDRPGQDSAVAAYSLSAAERRVAMLAARGKSNAVIASELSLSVHTVRAHLREIFAKLGVKHRAELVLAMTQSQSE
ncbi:helix-turn-helix transcriptional regulator [Luteolibacter pohnpeiensis]|uniref:Helix-turn-helix transcriptional regulator n=1 Tax=Luteolibacter pohnpeiensis TaxID=454153 RepID=A0A934VYK0_9BACT|nr:helix-turn-helix transcriptional regulator [Luteolibacter pohnpeiensis]MBK1884599.1 helix-turn-helix transcriptional regulator [Luteolibacter pohnpeiensis]